MCYVLCIMCYVLCIMCYVLCVMFFYIDSLFTNIPVSETIKNAADLAFPDRLDKTCIEASEKNYLLNH